ncbi:MAG: type II toxin-antitoxin system RelE/ParE family toxin [Defluviitaleaceae bacterium]|nr:type II toxin-antitoxin system RelE/ParE family toxin [Defluviitaleaceae bacterium]
MTTVLSPKAAKYLERLNEPIKSRIKAALKKLENEPPQGDIKAMAGQEGFRLRVGMYRILFGIRNDVIVVVDIGLRGQIYKRR